MKNIYTQILDNLENKELLNINDIEISLKNKSDIVTGHIEISYDQIKEEFDEISDTFMEYKILNVLENIFNDNQRIKIYLTGGGSNLLSGKLKSSVFKDSLIAVKDSQLSAVRGMYKYIMQKKK